MLLNVTCLKVIGCCTKLTAKLKPCLDYVEILHVLECELSECYLMLHITQ